MRLDHLLSRETLSCPDAVERSSRDLEEKGRLGPVHEERPQHPAPRAPGRLSGACPGHLDICIARDIDGIITSGPEKARAIARSESFRYAIPIELETAPRPRGAAFGKRRYTRRTADALAQEAEEGRGKLR